ncbi:penicillin-binding transpeptidase domain-containing protein [Nocardioides fonticola]|uniref:Beta-lactamase n=1 Tax=Nocardioides fonticola TaxID=450363 RepID=A0ABP7XSN6_9ACTN
MSRFGWALAALLLLVPTACSGGGEEDGPDLRPAAEALAAALTDGDFADVDLAGLTAEQAGRRYAAIVAGMDDRTPQVRVDDIAVTGTSATVTLAWSWTLVPGADAWTYTTEAPLTLRGSAWQSAWSGGLVEPSLADGEVLDAVSVPPQRGVVRGAGGRVLVTDRPVVRFGIDRSRVSASTAARSARRLADLLGIDADDFAARVKAAGPKAFVEGLVLRQEDVPVRVGRDYDTIPGAAAIAGQLPLAPTRTFAAPILGSVGPVTAEMVQDDPQRYRVGDVAGLSGLQARYDDRLRGTPGAVVDAVVPADGGDADSPGNAERRELTRIEPTNGTALRLSLDESLQSLAERVLAEVGPPSALVAIRPSTGAVLAAANGPGSALNLATYGQFPPGSTFKIVSSLALLRAGLTPSSTVSCPVAVTVDGKRFTNYSDYPAGANGDIPLATALANSCNTAFIGQRGRLDDGDLAAAAASLGVGVDHDLGFPAYFGQVPPPGSQTQAAADLIGQGGVLASPMAMATVLASVVAGRTVVPWLVDDVRAEPPADAAPLTAAETGALRSMLRGVVTGGSGRGLLDVPGDPVIAKTGTAEFERDGRTLTHAWMVGAQGDLAVAVFVDEGSSGSGTAGPLLEAFLRGR